MKSNCINKKTLVSLAVVSALSFAFAPTIFANESNLATTIGETDTVNVNEGDILNFGNTGRIHTNNGTIQGDGTLRHSSYGEMINNGTLDVAIYQGSGSTGNYITNEETGIVKVRDGNFGIGIKNAGTIISNTKNLIFTGDLAVAKDSKFVQSDNVTNLDTLTVSGNYFNVEEGATLQANKIVSNTITSDAIAGTVVAKEVNLNKTSYITGRLEGKIITLKETYAEKGAVIDASDKISFNGFSEVNDSTLSSPIIANPNSALYLKGKTNVEVQRFEIGSSLGIQSQDVRINENNRVEEVVFLAKENGSKPSIYLEKDQNLSIGTLTVNKCVKADGTVVPARLIDKTTPKNEGDTSFNVDKLLIKDGAIFSAYGDNDDEHIDKQKTSLILGQVEIGAGGELQFGWRDDGDPYMGFASQSIDSLTLADNAKVTTQNLGPVGCITNRFLIS